MLACVAACVALPVGAGGADGPSAQALTMFPGHGFGFVNEAQARQTGVARAPDRPDREYHPPAQPVEGDAPGELQRLPPVAQPETYPAWAEAARRPFPMPFAPGFRTNIRRQTPLYVALGQKNRRRTSAGT